MAAVIGGTAPKCPSHRDAGVWWDIDCLYFRCSRCGAAVTDPLKAMAPATTEDPRTALTDLHQELCDEARELSARKNQDYAAGEDPFANFRLCADMSLCSATTGVLVRMSDKMRRLASLETQEAQVLDESRRDTILDIINYAVILAALYSEPSGQE